MPFSSKFTEVVNSVKLFIKQITTSQRTPLLTILLHGDPGKINKN